MDAKGIGATLPMGMNFIVNMMLDFLVKIVYLGRIQNQQQETHANQRRTKMTEQEKYLEGHRNCGIKVGDRVRVTRKAESYEGGWDNSWAYSSIPEVPGMDAYVGAEGVVVLDNDEYGFGIDAGIETDRKLYSFPYFVLEKI